jgi:hypothetical protein
MTPESWNSGDRAAAVARERICKHASTTTKYARNNRKVVLCGVLCWVRLQAVNTSQWWTDAARRQIVATSCSHKEL